jgi:hypothetical protein
MSIFVSYRRSESIDIAGRIFDRLVIAFGPRTVFKDVDSVRLGRDFRVALKESLAHAQVVVAIIGRDWTTAMSASGTTLADEQDWVRMEIREAIVRSIPLIPVLTAEH